MENYDRTSAIIRNHFELARSGRSTQESALIGQEAICVGLKAILAEIEDLRADLAKLAKERR